MDSTYSHTPRFNKGRAAASRLLVSRMSFGLQGVTRIAIQGYEPRAPVNIVPAALKELVTEDLPPKYGAPVTRVLNSECDLYSSKLKTTIGESPTETNDPRDFPGEMFKYSESILTNRLARVYWKGVTAEDESRIKAMSAAKLGAYGAPVEYKADIQTVPKENEHIGKR